MFGISGIFGWLVFLIGFGEQVKPYPQQRQRQTGTDTITEQVEQITYRVKLRHVGCEKDGYWERCGAAERIEGDGVFKDVYLYPHKCSGATDALFNVSYPASGASGGP